MPSSTLKERLSLIPEAAFQHVVRAGGGEAGSDIIDFSVLSVAVTTLALILCVELFRHKLDQKSTGRPFYKTVLEGVYRELATLGIVEFFIFLLHKYYAGLNVPMELVFADVHFTLFFTALFNALGCVVVAFFVCRHSENLWVLPEYQDLHHYVEIREEFDRLERKLNALKADKEEVAESMQLRQEKRRKRMSTRNSIATRMWEHTGGEMQHSYHSLRNIVRAVGRSLRYPVLTRKHSKLLVQVRFHELKFHFIQANKLPITMHVSDYLKRSELHILMKMVHISTFAWLLLTAGINLVYFSMGVVVYATDADQAAVGTSLAALFFVGNIVFVVLSLIIWNKMTWIFHNIMHMKLISQTGSADSPDEDSDDDDGIFTSVRGINVEGKELNQKSLFWGSNPKYITIMIQFMQFGFAVAVSILLVFWDDINAEGGSINGGYFIGCVIICYSLFVYIIANVVPRFTLCSSVGQLVDQRRLHETLARHRLDEALRQRERARMEQEMEDSFMNDDSEDQFPATPPSILRAIQSIGSSVIPEAKPKASLSARDAITPELLEKLVLTDAKDLRNALPEEEQQKLSERAQKMEERRNRRKTLSDGVEAMRDMVGKGPLQNATAADRRANRQSRRKSVSASASIQMMREYRESTPPVVPAEALPIRAKDDSEILAEQKAKRRANRKKTMSASADIRMMRMTTVREESRSGSFSASTNSNSQQAPTTMLEKPFNASPMPDSTEATPTIETKPSAATSPLESANTTNTFPGDALPQKFPPVVSLGSSNLASLMESESEMSIQEDASQPDEAALAETSKPTKVDYGDGTKTEAESDDDDDDHSDADDLPAIQESDRRRKKVPPVPKRTMTDRAREYFRSRQYTVISGVFGTMVCFFIVGMRLEAVMICTGVLKDRNNTWQFHPEVGFWLEVTWLTMFVLVDFVILYTFRPSRMVDNRDRSSFAAAIIDCAICATCLALLLGAQAQRCCDYETENRFRLLAAVVVEKDDGVLYNCPATIECCPRFGARLYGGFGDVEMFTSLIALRLFRFLIAGFAIRRLDNKYGWSELLKSMRGVHDPTVDVTHPFDPLYERKGKGQSHGSSSLEGEAGTVVELWKQALGLYPDIVEKHGEFSSELLMAMLGIEVLDDEVEDILPTKSAEEIHDPSSEMTSSETLSMSPRKPSTRRSLVSSNNRRTSLTVDMLAAERPHAKMTRRKSICGDSKYSGLTAEAQAFILAGKLGKPVRARLESQASWEGSSSMGDIFEDSVPSMYAPTGQGGARQQRSDLSFGESQPDFVNRPPVMQPEFEVGAEFEDDDSSSQLFSPNARLLRSMRRCDRKLMPLLDKWTAVDVVMTKFEIVYFDVSDVDDIDAQTNPSPHLKRMQAIRQAIIATKGGKGLRLRDVAFGRRVVGHQELSNFQDIHVERILPHEGNVVEETGDEPYADEFWKDGHKDNMETLDESDRPSRNSRWMRVKEDRLKLKTNFDTLYLRFYSDLDSFEHNTERLDDDSENEGDIFKDNALQWCQTIGRLVGSGKLKQSLPHFGEDDNDELRDYLLVVDADNDPNSEKVFGRFKKTVANLQHRRQRSEPFYPAATTEDLPDSVPPLLPKKSIARVGRRSSSFGETTNVIEARKRSKLLRRAVSGGADLDTSSARRMKGLKRSGSTGDSESNLPAGRGHRRSASSGAGLDTSDPGKRSKGHKRAASSGASLSSFSEPSWRTSDEGNS